MLSSRAELDNLLSLKLLKLHKKSGTCVLTQKGAICLSSLVSDDLLEPPKSYHDYAIQRRRQIAKIYATAFRAGVDVFTTTIDALSTEPSLFLTSLARTQNTNPWGSTRVAAIAHIGDVLYAIHFIGDEVGKIALSNEFTIFNNQTAKIRNVQRRMIFAGESYQNIMRELVAHERGADDNKEHYGHVFRRSSMPIHLLPCDETGSVQLKIMSVPEYRTVFTHAAVDPYYEAPPRDAPVWDALYKGTPFVMAADMDLRRVDAALQLAKNRGIEKIAIVGLESQAESVFVPRYKSTGRVDIYALTDDILSDVLGDRAGLYLPSAKPYLTEEGDVIYAPSIKAAGKAGGYHHK